MPTAALDVLNREAWRASHSSGRLTPTKTTNQEETMKAFLRLLALSGAAGTLLPSNPVPGQGEEAASG